MHQIILFLYALNSKSTIQLNIYNREENIEDIGIFLKIKLLNNYMAV